MSKYYIYQDTKRCIGCFSCESHCKTKNNLPIGPRLTQIISVGPREINNLPRMAYVFMPCFHCQDPWCVAACPTGAMQKRPEDGIVFVDDNLCVGCKACITACPSMESADRQGSQVRFLHGSGRSGAGTGLCDKVRHQMPSLRGAEHEK
jgi:Fe-S-cluster-containing dehydrogenase component